MSKGYKYIKLFGMWLRIVFLAISLMACATFLLWQFGGNLVNRFDDFVVAKYQGHYGKRLADAISITSKDPSQGVVLLEELLNDLSEVRKRDRLERLKRMSYENIVQALETQGKVAQALSWAERWVAFDELDIFAQLRLSRLLYVAPGRKDEGKDLLDALYRKIPESSLVVGEHAERLFKEGDLIGAFLAVSQIYKTQDSLSGQYWQVFWDTGQGFNEKQNKDVYPAIADNGSFSFPLELPAGIQMLRIDPPIASNIFISKPMLICNYGGKEKILNLWEVPLGLSDMEQRGSDLIATGRSDPYFKWTLPPEMRFSGPFSGRVVARVEEAWPDLMERVAASSDVDDLLTRLIKMGELEAARMLQTIRDRQISSKVESLGKTQLDIYWKRKGEPFVEERKVRAPLSGRLEGKKYYFEMNIPLKANPVEVRIDFPDVEGVKYILEPLRIMSGENDYQIDLNVVDLVVQHMVERDGNHFKVTGEDPYFSVVLPAGGQVVDSVIVRGVAQ